MWICSIIAVLTFGGYLAYAIHRLGIPESLSATYYSLKEQGWMFCLMMVIVGVATMAAMLDITPDGLTLVPAICGAAICFVGVASQYMVKVAEETHCSCAVLAAVMAVAWVLLMRCWWLIPLCGAVILLLAFGTHTADRAHKTWWLEMWAFMTTFTALIFRQIWIG